LSNTDTQKADESAAQAADFDEEKTEEEIWQELDDAEEGTAAGDDKPAADASTAVEDPWSNAKPEIRSAFEKLRDENEKLTLKDKSSRGRIGNLQRQLNARQKGQAAGAATEVVDYGNSAVKPESWEDLNKEYPEIAGPVNERLERLEAAQNRIKEIEAAEEAQSFEDLVFEQTRLLNEEHNDWLTIAEDGGFGNWLTEQPRHIQEAAARNAAQIVDASEAGDLIARYKATRSEQRTYSAGSDNKSGTLTSLERKRRQQLESSSSTRSRGGAKATGIPEDGDEEAIWNAIDDQEAANARRQA